MTTPVSEKSSDAPTSRYDPPKPKGRVLSTLNEDGSRRWLRPRPAPGRFLTWRRVVAYALIAVFTLIPYIQMSGKPIILLDIVNREFTFFGKTFLPTDTLLLALFIVSVFVTVFFVTALAGRVWCGWACPQTVYLEFLYRPIERLFEGRPDAKGRVKPVPGWRKAAKYAVFLLCSLFLAHTFLAYFVGVETLFQWMQRSPLEHPTAFLVVAAVTGLMMFDFGFFREQVCIVACPYGRFQSVMLDRQSLIVSYDPHRGEPRGKLKRSPKKAAGTRKEGGDVSLKVLPEEPEQGDCIDCHMCVTTCPTGIDIREGLQMECVGCAQCIDACDAVMDKIGKPRGLIRYSSQAAIDGEKPSLIRPRVIIYPLILLTLVTAFIITLAGKQDADVIVFRGFGAPYAMLDSGEVANQVRVKITNRSEQTTTYSIAALGAESLRLIPPDATTVTLEPGEVSEQTLQVLAPPEIFERGKRPITVRVSDNDEFVEEKPWTLQGPATIPPPQTPAQQQGPAS
jgi:cytochrome c oxidase accessory protein FixG